jgi:dienelactone hydrolase
VSGPRVYNFLTALKENEAKDLPVATAGFCWGGQFVTKICWDLEQNHLSGGKRITECGFVAHPSFLSYPGDIEKIELPYACAASEIDPQMSAEQAKQTESILKEKTEKGKARGIEHEFVMYLGAHHGFAVRADEGDKEEAERGKKAEAQAIGWFERWFTNPPP